MLDVIILYIGIELVGWAPWNDKVWTSNNLWRKCNYENTCHPLKKPVEYELLSRPDERDKRALKMQ